MFDAKILLDSVSETGKRLTTFEATFPRIVLAEFNTHRMLTRNSASSRAIPFLKQLSWTLSDPFIPARFPQNTKGMQPQEYYDLGSYEYELAKEIWLSARDSMIVHAKKLTGNLPAGYISSGSDFRSDKEVFLNVHKQIANRLLEPFLWHKVIVTATEWSNFFKLRTHPDAQLEIRTIADLLYDLYHQESVPCPDGLAGCEVLHGNYKPKTLKKGEWHCPLIHKEDTNLIDEYLDNITGESDRSLDNYTKTFLEIQKKISVARCARVSYLTHEGIRDLIKDLELYTRLHTSGHWSPFEHVATPAWHREGGGYTNERHGNFFGWMQHRQEFPNENCQNFRKSVLQ